jgi:hypothetical protein
MQGARYCCLMLAKTGMCRQILVKVPNIKFHENQLERSRVFNAYRQTDGWSYSNTRSTGLRVHVKSNHCISEPLIERKEIDCLRSVRYLV